MVIIIFIGFIIFVFVRFLQCIESLLNRPHNVRNRLSIVFAPPRSGKTCLATFLAWMYARKGVRVYGNIPIKLPDKYSHMYTLIDWRDVGKYDFHDCEMLIDEAGIDLNNRNFKAMAHDTIKYLKYHGHFRCGMWYFSQSYDDMDITVRRLADDYYVVGKCRFYCPFGLPFNYRFKLRRIRRGVGINETTNQIQDDYQFAKFSTFRWNGKKIFNMFDSHSVYYLPPHPADVDRSDYEPSFKCSD